jgi:hypothetical protein
VAGRDVPEAERDGASPVSKRAFWAVTAIAALLFALLAVWAASIVIRPPGGEATDDQAPRPGPRPAPPLGPLEPLEPLRLPWDSEATADWPAAELLASMSHFAYRPPDTAETAYRGLGFDRVTPIVDGSMIGYVASAQDLTVIAFRGTDPSELADWLVNLDTLSRATPHGGIHHGFQDAYQRLKPQIVRQLDERRPRYLWVTGHSLGGALALTCAYDLIDAEKRDLAGIITFGQPMVARADLKAHLDGLLRGRFAHYVNEADIVPKVPPGFAHAGSLVWFKGDTIRRSRPNRVLYGAAPGADAAEGDIAPLSDQQFRQLKAELQAEKAAPATTPDGRPLYQGNLPLLHDHGIELYLVRIRRASGSDEQTNQPTD